MESEQATLVDLIKDLVGYVTYFFDSKYIILSESQSFYVSIHFEGYILWIIK